MINNKRIKILFCFVVISFLSLMGIFTITNNNEYSQYEGRELTVFPRVEVTDFLNDEIYNTYTNAFNDQMFIKNIFVKLFHLILPQNYIGDVVIGRENQLFYEPLIIENDEDYMNNLKDVTVDYINAVADDVTELDAKFIFLSIPRKDVVMNEYLPSSYYDGTSDYLKYVDVINNSKNKNVKFIDAYDILKNNKYEAFYQTDHHLNIRGGYVLFEEILNYINSKEKNKIVFDTLENEYIIKSQIVNGSYNRKTGKAINSDAEELNLTPKNEVSYIRYDNGEKSVTPIFGSYNAYASAYMGSDYGETVVDTELDSSPNILYVGTSFTNVLESLSVQKFNKMISIDYRHNDTGKSIVDYVKEYDIDYVVFICSQSNNSLNINSIKEQLGY